MQLRFSRTTTHGMRLVACLILASACDTTSPGRRVTVHLCGDPNPMVWAAVKPEGASSWSRVAPDGNGELSFPSSPRVALAYVRVRPGEFVETIALYLTREELEGLDCSTASAFGDKSYSGSFTGWTSPAPTLELGSIFAGGTFTTIGGPPLAQGNFTLGGIPDGPRDLVAARTTVSSRQRGLTRYVIRRAVNLSNGATLPAIDFTSAESFAPELHNISISGQVGATPVVVYRLHTTSTLADIYGDVAAPTWPLPFVPAAKTAAGDVHEVSLQDADSVMFRGASWFSHSAGDVSLSLPPVPSVPTIETAATTPYLRPRVKVPSLQAFSGVGVQLFNGLPAPVLPTKSYSVFVSSAYLGAKPATWELEVPDLSTVDGYQLDWTMPSGSSLSLQLIMYDGPLGLVYPFRAAPKDGQRLLMALRFLP